MALSQLQITSDADGDDRDPVLLDARSIFAVLEYLDQVPVEVRAAASVDVNDPLSRSVIESAFRGHGLTAKQLREIAQSLRTSAYEDSARGEVPVETGDGGEREPDYVNAVASMLEHLAWLAGDLGRVRAAQGEEAAA